MIRLRLLDDVAFDDVGLPAGRGHALLAVLATAGGRPVPQERLVEELWGRDDRPANPAKALQVVVSRVRAQTAPGVVQRVEGGYRLGLAAEAVDVLQARDRLRSAIRAEGAGDATTTMDAARAVLKLNVSPAGEGPVAMLRDAARADRSRAEALLGRALTALAQHAEALPLLESAPVDDEATQLALLRSEAAVRGAPAALHRYEQLRADLAERLGVDPGPRLQALHGELLAADHPVREGLRYDASTLVGRDGDLATLRALAFEHRVVSVLGPGGLGKTRLAHLLGRTAQESQVHLVELVGVSDPADVVGEVGSALGVRDSVAGRGVLTPAQRADVRGRIATQVDQGSTLLILDNCEHVVEAVADLVAYLVAVCPRLHVVTTTRAPLAIGAEHVFALGTLSEDDAVRLFLDRARAARPGTHLVVEEVRRVVDRLDGLPLAIELAAAKVRVMSVADVARRLGDRFALLRGGDRSAPDRHRTLLAVIDWSWALLEEPQRRALRRLALFHDGISVGAAESVLDDPDTWEVLASLVDQSLLTVVETDAGVRYRMLESVREFGRLRLEEAGESAEASAALTVWATRLAEECGRDIWGIDQLTAVDRLHAEEGNLAEILRRSLAAPEPAVAVRLLAALGALWTVRGDHPRVIALTGAFDTALEGWDPPDELVDAAVGAALMVQTNSAVADVRRSRHARRLLEHYAQRVEQPVVSALARVLGGLDPHEMEHWEERLAGLCEDPDRRVAMLALQWSSHGKENAGDPRGAVEVAERALALWRPEDGPWGRGQLLAQLTGLHAQLGEREASRRRAHEVLPLLGRLGAHDDAVQVRSVLAVAALVEGDLETARVEAAAVTGLAARATGGLGSRIAVGPLQAELSLAEGRLEEGLDRYLRAVESVRGLVLPGLEARSGLEPWVIFTEGAACAALARHAAPDDDRAVHLRDALAVKAGRLLEGGRVGNDLPVIGIAVFALAAWEVLRGQGSDRVTLGVRGLVLADAFGYPRYSPSLDWTRWAAEAEARAPGELGEATRALAGRRGPELLARARALVARIAPPGG
ncbi:AAA family ATPase [Nocardioides acrostichi]|uniref:AAA family ATPase n=1 Tax=Nocardioides acrostichi TaxID=2784339 RepID=A0A930V0C2_9ACTN|nr:AAA family ATPase [Nocardioides acrostichi]MBF4163047.1 AAA family ATPase [Nocardioides acrostichi]